ncbi:unnamed protein product [Enterobius vermicularis]|uniref:non-specific serine/threonine protein kinase n=1 Tax=Enterobius vermicularis TaxID=51028 RepID=A0A0N4UUC0_ENTVE|nr:unnamed protein product [Enterobius vermicularis]
MVGRCLGQGGFGTVFSALRLSDMKNAAVKVMQKTTIKEWRKIKGRKVPLEVYFLLSLKNVEGIIRFYDGYNFKYEYLLVMERPEHCQDLLDYMTRFQGLNETVTKAIFRQVLFFEVAVSSSFFFIIC